MTNWSQKDRSIGIETSLGDDALILLSFNGEEAISELFEFQLNLASQNLNITANEIVGNPVDLWIRLNDGSQRFINTYINRFTAGPMYAEGYRSYLATAVPWLWFLSLNQDSRIFQGKTVLQVLEDIFQLYPLANFEIKCMKQYPENDYCVQYQESDLAFINRLMQEYGIFYYFTHEAGKHTLVINDDASEYKNCIESTITHTESELSVDHVHNWEHKFQFISGKWTQKDFNFESPNTDLLTSSPTVLDLPDVDKYEKFRYPGGYTSRRDGEALTDVKMAKQEAEFESISAEGSYRSFTAGAKFTVEKHDFQEEENKNYVITHIQHQASEDSYTTNASGRHIYTNNFVAIPDTMTTQSAKEHKKPRIYGPQTAIVVGPHNEEIHTDEYGRVRVSFHWDRYSVADENASCWIRVSQNWAGKNWGAMSIPRIGQEVIVSFLNGDPDRPIITGRVYNGEQITPHELPENATMTTFKTNSSKGGEGFNELRFEDKKDEEQIFIHAQKNFDLRVKSDRFESIGNDRNLVVENDKKEHVKNNQHELTDSNKYEKIGGDRHLKIIGQEAKAVDGNLSLGVGGDVAEEISGNHSEKTGGDNFIKASNIVIEGSSNITLKVGQSYVAIESGGIKIGSTGTIELDAVSTVEIKGTSGVTIESSATAELKSTSTTVNGDAMLTLKGGLVKIN